MYGFDLYGGRIMMQVVFLLLLACVLCLDSYRDYKVRTLGMLSQRKTSRLLSAMIMQRFHHEPIRELYGIHVSNNFKINWFILAGQANISDFSCRAMNGNYYFYRPNSGFMTIIPIHHVTRD